MVNGIAFLQTIITRFECHLNSSTSMSKSNVVTQAVTTQTIGAFKGTVSGHGSGRNLIKRMNQRRQANGKRIRSCGHDVPGILSRRNTSWELARTGTDVFVPLTYPVPLANLNRFHPIATDRYKQILAYQRYY